jgi:G3E family GTPase
MKIIVISGFLGCGKTTLVISMAKQLSSSGKSVAIVENDFSQIGIDHMVLKEMGYTVKELGHGCICCSLGPNLLASLNALEEEMRPDIVLVEPSGIANPEGMRESLKKYPGKKLEAVEIIVLIDGPRFRSMLPMFERSLRLQISAADVICISKSDMIDDERADEITNWLLVNAPGKKVVHLALPPMEGADDVRLEVVT